MRLAIAGSFGYMDIGDEAMLTEDLEFITGSLGIPRERILLFAQNLSYVSTYHSHPEKNCLSSDQLEVNWRLHNVNETLVERLKFVAKKMLGRPVNPRYDRALERNLKKCDAVLITGGGTINTRDQTGYSIRRMHTLVSYFRYCGLPIFMSGQTIGPLGLNADHDRMAREIVNAVDILTVRDQKYSRDYLNVIGSHPENLLETFDDAYTLEYESTNVPSETSDFVTRKPTVAINTTDYTGDHPEQKKFIAKLCERLIVEDGRQVVLVSHTPNDMCNHQSIFAAISPECRQYVHLPDTSLWTGSMLKKLISMCAVAIGGRYHFIVFAGTSNTPFVGMCGNRYSYIKQDGFARALDMERFILSENETWDMAKLWGRYEEASSLTLALSERFSRPSESMRFFAKWIHEKVA